MIYIFTLYPIADVIFAVIWFLIGLSAWQGAGGDKSGEEENAEERTLGATVIMGQLNATITGASILIAGAGTFAAIGRADLGSQETYHILYAAIFAVMALGLSLYTMGVLPTRTPKVNFVRSRDVALLCSMALYLSLIAGIRFILAIGSALISS